jgi:coenzyme F420-reducing hydrogenase delta subunit
MPFRRASALVPGIDLPELTIATLRERVEAAAAPLAGSARVMVFGCRRGVPLDGLEPSRVATVELACAGQLPPSFIDYVLSKGLADGVLLTGCAESACHERQGIAWTEARLAGTRDPQLRARVPRERLRTLWPGRTGHAALQRCIAAFQVELEGLPRPARTPHRRATTGTEAVDG